MTPPEKPEEPGTSLSRTLGSDHLTDSLTTVADVGLDAAVASLHGVPILGVLVGLYRGGRDVKKELELRQIVRFLTEIDQVPAKMRAAFTAKLQAEDKLSEFGENILLLLSRLDSTTKPTIIGKLIAAHIEGHIDYAKSMRLAAIVDRCYASDLEYLKSFKPGVQGSGTAIATMLFSAGLLADNGIDGGNFSEPDSGGTIFGLNEYGDLLLKFGLA